MVKDPPVRKLPPPDLTPRLARRRRAANHQLTRRGPRGGGVAADEPEEMNEREEYEAAQEERLAEPAPQAGKRAAVHKRSGPRGGGVAPLGRTQRLGMPPADEPAEDPAETVNPYTRVNQARVAQAEALEVLERAQKDERRAEAEITAQNKAEAKARTAELQAEAEARAVKAETADREVCGKYLGTVDQKPTRCGLKPGHTTVCDADPSFTPEI